MKLLYSAAFILFACAFFSPSPARAKGYELGWRPEETVFRWPGSSGDGYAATVYKNRDYVADVATVRTGDRSYSEIRFSTNRSGKWERTLVAKIPDDPNTGGPLPQITVIPASGHVVIVVIHPKSNGAEFVSYTNASGAWTPTAAPPAGGGPDAFVNPTSLSLAADGSEATLAFNASSQDTNCAGQGAYIYLSHLKDGAPAWSGAKNVTADYCGAKGGFAKNPVLVLSGGKDFIAYQCAGDPNGSPGAMCLRSGDLGGTSEEIVETNTPDWGMAPGLYALAVDGGVPILAYVMNQNNQLRLMTARKDSAGWKRTQLATGGSPKTSQALSLAPAVAGEAARALVAYVGYAAWPLGGNNSQAVYMTAEETSGSFTKPWNFTRSKNSDATPVLASSDGFTHLFIERDGQSLLWSRQEPVPIIAAEASSRGLRAELKGTIAPASAPENLRICLEQILPGKPGSRETWKRLGCDETKTTPENGRASFTTAWPKLAPGRYRARAEAGLNDEHLSRLGAWNSLVVADAAPERR